MSLYRNQLPQFSQELFLADAGIETDLIFNHGIAIREFAAHTLLETDSGRKAVASYFRGFLALAQQLGTGFILDSQTWKAHLHWAKDLACSEAELRQANHDSIAFIANLRQEFSSRSKAIVLNGLIGPRGDAYAPEHQAAIEEAEAYHGRQLEWLAETEVDMVTATTFTQSEEAAGVIRAGKRVGLPVVVSFTVETDGRLPGGQPLAEAIEQVDQETDQGAAYFMVNCAHPDHFQHVLQEEAWAQRIRGLRCNASRKSHAELDQSESLDDGNPVEFAEQYVALRSRMPWLNVFGGCCGSDLRHVSQVARRLTAQESAAN
ncbi:MAG: homocysteine S-methyltransferase [Planctomycetota bacterium]|nr:MAG: homocysteine S-methyltransferase [Planctomycetota bacterium]